MRTSTMLRFGAALLCCIVLAQAQNQDCKCNTLFNANCNFDGPTCSCTVQIGPEIKVPNCNKLFSKCWLMKKESLPGKEGKRPRPKEALVDNDGLYNPDCDTNGTFVAKQCNGTNTCWCVNSAGVRRTDKGDNATWKCPELVRTNWIVVQMKGANTDKVPDQELKAALRKWITSRYGLPAQYIEDIEIGNDDAIYIDLKQSTKHKEMAPNDVDIADVAYYIEKDVKKMNLMHADNKFEIPINGKNFVVEDPLILYIDEKPHEISMKHLTPGIIAVIVVVVVAIVAGIVVLVFTRRKRGKYEKAEMKEMNELNS